MKILGELMIFLTWENCIKIRFYILRHDKCVVIYGNMLLRREGTDRKDVDDTVK